MREVARPLKIQSQAFVDSKGFAERRFEATEAERWIYASKPIGRGSAPAWNGVPRDQNGGWEGVR
jgi:hypothetical protein